MSACSRHAPELYSLMHTWIDGSANHVAQGGAGEDACTVEQHVGLDQGCPLSPALYGIAVRDALESTEEAMRAVDEKARVKAFLDDTYLIGSPEATDAGATSFNSKMEAMGLKLRLDKTKIWSPTVPKERLPILLQPYWTETLITVGAPVPYAKASSRRGSHADEDDRTDTPLDIGCLDTNPDAFIIRLREYLARLEALQQGGLSLVHILTPLRTWTQGAGVHIIRAFPVTREWTKEVDKDVMETFARLAGMENPTETQTKQFFMPTIEGGMGMGSMEARHAAAWLGAWEAGISEICEESGITSMIQLQEQWPAMKACIGRKEETYKDQTGETLQAHRWTERITRTAPKRQAN